MNTNRLKRFAQEARVKLLDQVNSRLELILNTDSAELREKAASVQQLKEAIKSSSREQVVDKVAYTWFNRLMALRFMDVNDYQPLKLKIITPKEGYTLSEILEDTNKGQIPEELPVNKQKINDLLNGKIPSSNAQNEIYKELLIGACNHLHSVFPFLFEKINDYTELLLPSDLTSEFSIINDFVEGIQEEDCQEVEVIGWLYQFYISEKKDELINAKKRYKADEIAPVTQLFTPKWIVQYMVENSLGQIWKEAKPNTKLTNSLEFFIQNKGAELPSRKSNIEEITFFDPCVGSGHILSYAFDLFYKMYEEEGYNPSEIPELILTKNLFGIDIDDRAAQLASFTLMIKGRKYHRRFFKKGVIPKITSFQNVDSDPKFRNAKVLGSLIKVSKQEVDDITIEKESLFVEKQRSHKMQAQLLASRYDVVVTNPPYLNSSYMEGTLKNFIDKEYKETKADLFACFIIQASNLTKSDGLVGFICPYVWMFIRSYESLREFLLSNTTISSLVQLEYNAFGPAVVPIATFVFRNRHNNNLTGSYIRLSEFKGIDNQAPRTLEAIHRTDCKWLYRINQEEFKNIPGSPIAYWLSNKVLELIKNNEPLSSITAIKKGMATGDNLRFVREWFEVEINDFGYGYSRQEAKDSQKKWFPYSKGGGFRKWAGHYSEVVLWQNDGEILRSNLTADGKRIRATNFNLNNIFKPSIAWTVITNIDQSFRIFPAGFLYDSASGILQSDQPDEDLLYKLLGFLNSKITNPILAAINPTINLLPGYLGSLPALINVDSKVVDAVKRCVDIAILDWDSKEKSWNFKKNELVRIKNDNLKEAFEAYTNLWTLKLLELKKIEENINQLYLKAYDLEGEFNSNLDLKEVNILEEEVVIKEQQIVFNKKEVFAQFMSYAVGCMFGRYSLDKEGVILANKGESLRDFLEKIQNSNSVSLNLSDLTFVPDEDNIIPVLEDEWFEDDIVGRFFEFLKVSFGKANFDKNLAFVEECIGKDVRKYFVKEFYKDHLKRYKKRPIYWMFSSPKGSFNVLIYMQRYTPDTLNNILNGYLLEYKEKIKARIEHLDHIIETGSSTEQTKAGKEKDRLKKIILELQDYEREILYPLATERISIDLDDGVLVNYNKFGRAIQEVKDLSDKKAKKKVRRFDWIDTTQII